MRLVLQDKFKKIKLLALDFDGILTDGNVYVFQDGKEAVRCSRRDGFGIELLKGVGIIVCVISKEINPIVKMRSDKLDIPCWQGIVDGPGKLAILKRLTIKYKLSVNQIAYMGDDLNDSDALKYVGVGITVADGHPVLKKAANYITKAKGGDHAVREVAELILKYQKKSAID